MENPSETKEKFLEEISELKKKIQKLVKSESQHKPQEIELHTSELKFRQRMPQGKD